MASGGGGGVGVECQSSFSLQDAFKNFTGEVPLKQLVCIEDSQLIWKWYEVGDPSLAPLICLHGLCGGAENFFQQVQTLKTKGYRVLSVQWPAYSSLDRFVSGFDQFLSHLNTLNRSHRPSSSDGHSEVADASMGNGAYRDNDTASGTHIISSSVGCNDVSRTANSRQLHLLGSELGGLLALHYAAKRPQLVKTVIVCNSFANTDWLFSGASSLRAMCGSFLSVLPHAALRKIMISNFLRPKPPIRVCQPSTEIPSGDIASDLQTAWSAFVSGFNPANTLSSSTRRHICSHVRSRNVPLLWDSFVGDEEERGNSLMLRNVESLETRNSKEFLIAHLDDLSANDISARLAMQLTIEPAPPLPHLRQSDLLIIHALDSGNPPEVEQQLLELYPQAKLAALRSGGPFPFLSSASEVTMHIQVHMRRNGIFPDLYLLSAEAQGITPYHPDSERWYVQHQQQLQEFQRHQQLLFDQQQLNQTQQAQDFCGYNAHTTVATEVTTQEEGQLDQQQQINRRQQHYAQYRQTITSPHHCCDPYCDRLLRCEGVSSNEPMYHETRSGSTAHNQEQHTRFAGVKLCNVDHDEDDARAVWFANGSWSSSCSSNSTSNGGSESNSRVSSSGPDYVRQQVWNPSSLYGTGSASASGSDDWVYNNRS